jgi:hypothetical protein
MRLAIAYGKAAGERRFNTCCGIRVSSGEPCQFVVTKTGCGVNYCNQHKKSAPLAVIANGVPSSVICVACGNPSEDRSKDMFECASCPIVLHRHCLFEWEVDHAPSVSEALAAGQTTLLCVRCSFMRPHVHKFFADAVGTEGCPVIVIPLPLRYINKHGALLMECANKLAEHYGSGYLAPGRAAITPEVMGRTPRSTVQATPEEIRLMEEKKLEKGVAEQLRTALQVKLKADIAEGMTVELPQTARRRLGNMFDAPQKDTGEANVGQQQPALVPPSGDVQPPIAAATSDATQMAEMSAEMKLLREQMARIQGAIHQSTPARLLPPAPVVSLAGPKV